MNTRLLLCASATLTMLLASNSLADPPRNGLTEAEKRGGWRVLFDGKTTKGWRSYRGEGVRDGWVVEDGALTLKRRAGDLISEQQFDHFELSLEYRISKGGNSGLMFHVTEEAAAPWQTGPEVQIQDNVAGRDPQKSGWLYQLYKPVKPVWAQRVEKQAGIKTPEVADATRPAGQWNTIYLRVSKQQSELALNGVSYYYFRKGDKEWDERVAKSKFARYPGFGKAAKGHLCLQDHGNLVSFRNIKIRELPADGATPEPIDAKLPIEPRPAFAKMKWTGWEGVDEDGKIQPLRPMILTHAGDGSNRVFVGTQRGVVHVFEGDDDAKQTRIFLDIRERVFDWRKENEEGLLGLAFHPRYKQNGQFFVYYSSAADPRTSIVARYRVSADDVNRADPKQEVVMRIPQPFSNHNGGSIAFGPDGYLYIALGDGGGRNDPLGHGQNLKTLMGSILRIDVDRKSEGRAYAIPDDNPFVDRPGARGEIYAYGFRNVWRMSFDRQTGQLWAADVGQDLWEEINIVRPGGNYGWSVREATYSFNNGKAGADKPIEPVWEYDHQAGKSITGGFVYRGKKRPELRGMYLYADFVSGKIWALQLDPKTGRIAKNYGLMLSAGVPVIAFGEDEQGEVYYLIEAVKGTGVYRFASIKKAAK